MSCFHATDLDGMVEMVENCAIAYGGVAWRTTALLGLAFVIVVLLLAFTLFLLLRSIR